jgi:glycosyltransferase involved in cell wall biosynthesis
MRSFFKISEGDPVVGVVARFQRYRRMNIFLEAIARVIKEVPNLRALMVGRSSQMKDTVIKPIEALNLTKNVILAGYRMDDYVATLAIMDIFVFLVAGSDGTGRALREAIAMGKPAIVARRGMLPEMVEEGVAGLVIDDTPDNLAKAILKLVKDEKLRKNMGEAAYKKARRDFAIERQAEEVEMFYEKIRGL